MGVHDDRQFINVEVTPDHCDDGVLEPRVGPLQSQLGLSSMFGQHGVDDQDFQDLTICSEVHVAAFDAPAIDLYSSVLGSDGDSAYLFPPVIDSEYTDWSSKDDISETNFGSMTPGIGEMSDEDECVSESSIAAPRRTQRCSTDHNDMVARERASGSSLAYPRLAEIIPTVPPSRTTEMSMLYDSRSRAKRRLRGKPYKQIRFDQHRVCRCERVEATESSDGEGPPSIHWSSDTESERGSPIAESSG